MLLCVKEAICSSLQYSPISSYFLNTGEKSVGCSATIRVRCVVTCMEDAVPQAGMGAHAFVIRGCPASNPSWASHWKSSPFSCVQSWSQLVPVAFHRSKGLQTIPTLHWIQAQQVPVTARWIWRSKVRYPSLFLLQDLCFISYSQLSRVPLLLPAFLPDPQSPTDVVAPRAFQAIRKFTLGSNVGVATDACSHAP